MDAAPSRDARRSLWPLLSAVALLTATGLHAAASPSVQKPDSGYVVMPDGVRLFYRMLGSGGETVVMLHGGPASVPTLVVHGKRDVLPKPPHGSGRPSCHTADC